MQPAAVETPEHLSVADRDVRYGNDRTLWALPVEDVRLIGEYTTPNGPQGEDYFVVFLDRDGRRYEVPASAITREAADALRKRIGPFGFGLAHTTDLDSRIMWPPEYADEPLFSFTRVPARTIGERVRRLLGNYAVDLTLTSAAEAAIHNEPRRAAAVVHNEASSGTRIPALTFGEHVRSFLGNEPVDLTLTPAAEAAIHNEASSGARILVASDPYVVKLVVEALQHHDVSVDATHEHDVVERISHDTYHLLVVDLETSGYDVFEYRRNHPDDRSRVVVITDDPLSSTQRRLVDGVLAKPLQPEALELVQQYVSESAQTKAG